MRIGVLIAVIAAVVGCGASSAGTGATPPTDLRISFFEDGQVAAAGADKTWTLRCDPAGGTLPRRIAACQKLDQMRNPFAPLRKDLQCTQIYGGPERAVITGTYEGKRVWTLLAQRNGCEIARWRKLAFLVGGIGPASANS
jgi:subtilisin inhibitor-like